jgi:hypothetical protein
MALGLLTTWMFDCIDGADLAGVGRDIVVGCCGWALLGFCCQGA